MASNTELSGGVVVTGGGSGIGRAVVLACADRGAKVAVLDFKPESAEAAAAEARERGAAATIGLECDVRDEASVASAIDAAAEAVGPLGGLVACAGIDRGGLVHELDLSVWQDVIATNLTGTFLTCKYVLRKLVEQESGGSIVLASSPWAQVSSPDGASAYCASKGGVSSLVRSLALDYAPHGIRVNAIVPGATETPLMWANIPPAELPEIRNLIASQIPFRRLAMPDEIAAGIVWLLSDDSRYATGSHLVIDGGLLANASIAT